MLELPFSFCISKIPGKVLIFRTFIVLILVCMDRGDPYLPIDTKINFHRGFGLVYSGVTPMGSGWANPRAPELRGHPQGAPSL